MKNTSSRYRILWPRPKDGREAVKHISHWVFSMNGLDYMCYKKDGTYGRGFAEQYEFPPQWQYVNDKLKRERLAIPILDGVSL